MENSTYFLILTIVWCIAGITYALIGFTIMWIISLLIEGFCGYATISLWDYRGFTQTKR